MDQKQQLDMLDAWYREERELAINKGHDYATEDVLANFRRMFRACQLYDINPSERLMDVYLFYMLIKFDRICNLVHSDKEPRNESLHDSFADLRMYGNLARLELLAMAGFEKTFDIHDEGAAEQLSALGYDVDVVEFMGREIGRKYPKSSS